MHPKIHHSQAMLLSFYDVKTLPKLLAAAKAAKVPKHVPIYVGQYGISRTHADEIHSVLGKQGRYAPLLSLNRKKVEQNPYSIWNRRNPNVSGPAAYAGRIPRLEELSAQYPTAGARHRMIARWGLELGRRMRDNIRAAQRHTPPIEIDSWQLDELWPSGSKNTPAGANIRSYMRGVLLGLYGGRPDAGDRPLPGMIHIAQMQKLAELPMTSEVKAFWRALNRSTFRVIGETYPRFTGDPKKKADQTLDGYHLMQHNGGIQAAIARKYMAGLTPGFATHPAYGGERDGNIGRADKWRDAFIAETLNGGVHGISEYNWLGRPDRRGSRSDSPVVIRHVLAQMADQFRKHPTRLRPNEVAEVFPAFQPWEEGPASKLDPDTLAIQSGRGLPAEHTQPGGAEKRTSSAD